jgi:hypothetical protein
MTKRTRMQRRTFLRGSLGAGLGVSIGLPLLDAMLNEHGTRLAHGQALPKRYGMFFFGNGRGVEPDRWIPTGTGAAWTPSVELAPLAGIKDYVSVVTGMNARLANSPQGHHKGSAAILSGYDFITQPANNAPYRSTFSRPSIDQVIAAEIGATTAFKSLEIGTSRRVINGEGTTIQYISHNGPDSGNPPELDPRKLFDRLFAEPVAPPTGGAPSAAGEALRLLRRSVLDTVIEDLGALGRRVGTADRARLEQHTESIRAIERRLETDLAAPTLQCENPMAPAEIAADNSREPLAERLDAMGDLLAIAMSCDLSRVFSIQWSGSAGGPTFWQVGATRGHHDLSHDGDSSQEIMEAITIFTMEQFALLLQKFRDTPDGAGNLLDSMLVLASSDHGDGAAHDVEDYPVLIAGRAGGALVHPGVHVREEDEHTNTVLLTVLRAMGLQTAEIGEGNYRRTAGVSALEA